MDKEKVSFFWLPAQGGALVMEMRAESEATVGDFLRALEAFAEENIASCLGCVACCQERAPLTIIDAPALLSLLPEENRALSNLLDKYASLEILPDGAADLALKRKPNGACVFLDEKNLRCSVHRLRPLVCASHFCLPRGPAIERLRSLLINRGMDELIALLLRERPIAGLDQRDYPLSAAPLSLQSPLPEI